MQHDAHIKLWRVIARTAAAIYTARGLYLSPADSLKAADAAVRELVEERG